MKTDVNQEHAQLRDDVFQHVMVAGQVLGIYLRYVPHVGRIITRKPVTSQADLQVSIKAHAINIKSLRDTYLKD